MEPVEPEAVSLILDRVREHQDGAEERLFELVYAELRRVAHGQMSREAHRGTLQTTALVNEAYLRLVKGNDAGWENRRHFFGAASRAMRQILVDRARTRDAVRHGGDRVRVPLEDDAASSVPSVDLLALDEALNRLATERPRQAQVVQYRYFLGLTTQQTAELLDVSPRTVEGDWTIARSWLRREMEARRPPDR